MKVHTPDLRSCSGSSSMHWCDTVAWCIMCSDQWYAVLYIIQFITVLLSAAKLSATLNIVVLLS